jgi:HNH endonuclease/AP2 domain
MRKIFLSGKLGKGKFLLVDNYNFGMFCYFSWSLDSHGYALAYVRGSGAKNMKRIKAHQIVMTTPKGMQVDHINGNKLDNREENLRICTNQQNCWNKKAMGNTSKYKGVCWNTAKQKWMTQIRAKGKHLYLGLFDNEIEAAKIYNENARKFFGEFSKLNEIPCVQL